MLQLFSAKSFQENVIGVAYIGGLCVTGLSAGDLFFGYLGYSYVNDSPNAFSAKTDLSAHEVALTSEF